MTNGEKATSVEEIKQVPPPIYTFWANKFLTNLANFRDATWLQHGAVNNIFIPQVLRKLQLLTFFSQSRLKIPNMVVVFSMKKANVYFQKRVKDADIKDLNRRQILGLISDIQQENAEKTTMECF